MVELFEITADIAALHHSKAQAEAQASKAREDYKVLSKHISTFPALKETLESRKKKAEKELFNVQCILNPKSATQRQLDERIASLIDSSKSQSDMVAKLKRGVDELAEGTRTPPKADPRIEERLAACEDYIKNLDETQRDKDEALIIFAVERVDEKLAAFRSNEVDGLNSRMSDLENSMEILQGKLTGIEQKLQEATELADFRSNELEGRKSRMSHLETNIQGNIGT